MENNGVFDSVVRRALETLDAASAILQSHPTHAHLAPGLAAVGVLLSSQAAHETRAQIAEARCEAALARASGLQLALEQAHASAKLLTVYHAEVVRKQRDRDMRARAREEEYRRVVEQSQRQEPEPDHRITHGKLDDVKEHPTTSTTPRSSPSPAMPPVLKELTQSLGDRLSIGEEGGADCLTTLILGARQRIADLEGAVAVRDEKLTLLAAALEARLGTTQAVT